MFQNPETDIIVFCNTNKSKNTEKYGVYSLKHINPLHPHSAYTSHSRFNPCSTDQPSQPCIPQYQWFNPSTWSSNSLKLVDLWISDVRGGFKLNQIVHKWDFFRSDFSTFGSSSQMYWNLIWKSPGFVQLGVQSDQLWSQTYHPCHGSCLILLSLNTHQ